MADKSKEARVTKTKTIDLEQRQGTFSALFSRLRGNSAKEESEVGLLRSLLSNEKARILHTIKVKQPNSLYELAKLLGRDFKSVRADISMLEKFGFIEMIPIHKGNRSKLKPVLAMESLQITINI